MAKSNKVIDNLDKIMTPEQLLEFRNVLTGCLAITEDIDNATNVNQNSQLSVRRREILSEMGM